MEPMSFTDHLQEGMNHINLCNAQIKEKFPGDFARVNMHLSQIANMLINAAPRIDITRPEANHFQEASYGNGNQSRSQNHYNAPDHMMVQGDSISSHRLKNNLSAYDEERLIKENQTMQTYLKENFPSRNLNSSLSAYEQEMKSMKEHQAMERSKKENIDPRGATGANSIPVMPRSDRYLDGPLSRNGLLDLVYSSAQDAATLRSAPRHSGFWSRDVIVPHVINKNKTSEATRNSDTPKMDVAIPRPISSTSGASRNPDTPKMSVAVPRTINNTSEATRNPDILEIHVPTSRFIINASDAMRNYDHLSVNTSVPRVISNAGGSARSSDKVQEKPSSITQILQRPSTAIGSASSSSIASILSQDIRAPKIESTNQSLDYAGGAVLGSVKESNENSTVLPQATEFNSLPNDLPTVEKQYESMAEKLAKKHAEEELAKKREEEEEKRAEALKNVSPFIVKSSWAGIAVKGVNDEESKPLDMRAQVPPPAGTTRGFVRIGGVKSKAALRPEPEADQLRGVFILNPPETMTANDLSNGIHEGALLAIRPGIHPDTKRRYFGIIFQWAPSATNFLAIMEEERKKSTSKRFSFIADCVRGTPVPRDEWLLAMEEPVFARRRLTLAQKGLFFTWKRQDIERFCWKHVGRENVQFVHMYNGGNATICFTEVEAAIKIRGILEEMVKNGAENRRYNELCVGYSKDPCEAEVRFLTSSDAHHQ